MDFEDKNLILQQVAEFQQLLSRITLKISESECADEDYESDLWVTVTQASIILECSVGTVSHMVNKNILVSNGKTRKKRRVYAPSVTSYIYKRNLKKSNGDESDDDYQSFLDESDSW